VKVDNLLHESCVFQKKCRRASKHCTVRRMRAAFVGDLQHHVTQESVLCTICTQDACQNGCGYACVNALFLFFLFLLFLFFFFCAFCYVSFLLISFGVGGLKIKKRNTPRRKRVSGPHCGRLRKGQFAQDAIRVPRHALERRASNFMAKRRAPRYKIAFHVLHNHKVATVLFRPDCFA
jgi:hypothetical protein